MLDKLARLAARSAQLREVVLEKDAGMFDAIGSGASKAWSGAGVVAGLPLKGAGKLVTVPMKWGVNMIGKGATTAIKHPLATLGVGLTGAEMLSKSREYGSGFTQPQEWAGEY